MNIKNFVKYGVCSHQMRAPRMRMHDSKELVLGQACSVRELIIRQQKGLPLPPMTSGYVFNGLALNELPKSSGRYADRSDVIKEMQSSQAELRKSGLQYNIN